MTQPTTGYTSDEITAAVSGLVQASITRVNDTLGPARSDLSFGEIQQAAAGVFLLYPKAPFYCLSLGALRIAQQVQAEAAIIDQLLAAIQAVGRSVLPINDLTPLFNASSALQALGTAAAARTTTFQNIQAVPAFQRFSQNVQTFLATSGQTIKSQGQVVMTPQQARQSIPSLVQQFQTAHTALTSSITTLAGGQADYNAVNLASIVAQSVIANATTVVQGHANALAALQPVERLALVRQTVLDLIAAKSVVTMFGSTAGTTSVYSVAGIGLPYSDSTHLALPAQADATIAGPYNIQSPKQYLDLYLDGAGFTPRTLTSITQVIPIGFGSVASLVGTIPLDVAIGDYIFLKAGLNAGTRWVIQSVGPSAVTAYGVVVPIAETASIPVDVLPPPSVELVLPFASAATLLGVVTETVYPGGTGYLISDGSHPTRFPPSLNTPAACNLLKVQVGVTTYNCPLTLAADSHGSVDALPRTAQQVCDDINAVLTPSGFQAVPYFPTLKFQGSVIETSTGGSTATFALVGGFSNFLNLGVNNGDLINVVDGDGSQRGVWTITTVAATVLTATKLTGSSVTQVDAITIQVGGPLRAIKLQAINPTTAVNTRASFSIVNDNGVGLATAATIGLTAGATARSTPQTSKDLATFITKNTTLCSATTLFTPVVTVKGRSNQTNAFILTLTKFETTGSTSVTGPTLVAPIQGALSAGAAVGDFLMERDGQFPGTVWQLTIVNDTSVTATLVSGSSVSQASVTLEIGPNVTLPSYSMIRVTSGPNNGDYYVSSQNFLDITLVSTLPNPFSYVTNQPITFELQAGAEALVISSSNTTTASLVKVRGPAAAAFFASGDAAVNAGVAGTTTFFQVPQVPQGLAPGDLLQFFIVNYALPSSTHSITDVTGQILTLADAIASNVSWDFSVSIPPPFARLHTGHVADFSEFQAGLLAWGALAEQQPLFFTNLNRLINPLLANTSPTAVQVNNATLAILGLYQELTIAEATARGAPPAATIEAILASYTVAQQPPVDALIRSYTEKGADRAIDLILAGSFQLFFGLDPSSTSYGGAMQVAARAVAMNDLPVKKLNRTNTQTSRLVGSTTDPDPEYNFDDSTTLFPDPLGPDDQANGS